MFKRGIWKGNVERREGRGRKGDKKREKGGGGTRRENRERERDWFGLAYPQLLQPSELKCQICECPNTLGVQTSQAFMNPGPAVIWLHLPKRTPASASSLSLIHTLNCVRNKFSFNPLNFGVVCYTVQRTQTRGNNGSDTDYYPGISVSSFWLPLMIVSGRSFTCQNDVLKTCHNDI